MSSVFLKQGSKFRVTDTSNIQTHEKLPVGNYIVREDESGLYLDAVEKFELPSRIYGDTEEHVERILTAFGKTDKSLGTMLCGEKGSGKTLLAKTLSVRAAEKYGMATVLINEPRYGDSFFEFIQMCSPSVVIFDEYEKVYNEEQQQQNLTLFDGVFQSKNLYIITTNDVWSVSGHMHNRPGRMRYWIDYVGLDNSAVEAYATENLKDKANIDTIVKMNSIFNFNFDMLHALVSEVNLFGGSPYEIIKILNIKLAAVYGDFCAKITENGKELTISGDGNVHKHPLSVAEWVFNGCLLGDGGPLRQFRFKKEHFVGVDRQSGDITFERGNTRLVFTKSSLYQADIRAL